MLLRPRGLPGRGIGNATSKIRLALVTDVIADMDLVAHRHRMSAFDEPCSKPDRLKSPHCAPDLTDRILSLSCRLWNG